MRWAITADQDVAVKAVIAGLPPVAWQDPEPGCGYQVADAVHTRQATKTAFRLSIKREERPQGDLFDALPGSAWVQIKPAAAKVNRCLEMLYVP